LEPGNDVTVKPESDPQVAALAQVLADLQAWRPGVDGVLDDIQKDVQKLVKTLDHQVFDDSSHRPVALHSPPAATALAPATGLHATPPSGHRVDLTPRDARSGVITTWTMSRPMVCFLHITLIILFLNFVRRLPSFIRVQCLIPFTIHLPIYITPSIIPSQFSAQTTPSPALPSLP